MSTYCDKYISYGIKIIPLHNVEAGKCSCKDPNCKSPGKHPRITDWDTEGTCEIAKIKEWKRKWPKMNVGGLTGKASGILVIDIDPRHGGDKSLENFEKEHGKLPSTLTTETGGGGLHFIYKYPTDIKITNRQNALPGIDVRGENGYIILPPSVHASGKTYTFENNEFESDKIAELSNKAFLALIIRARKKNTGVYNRTNTRIPNPQRALGLIRNLPCYQTYVDQYGDPYIRYSDDEGKFRDILVKGKSMEILIKTIFYRETKSSISKEQLEQVTGSIEAEALSTGETHALYLRVAELNGGLYYDLGDGLAVKTTPFGWEITKDVPILFKRYQISKKQVIPVTGGDVNALFNFFNIKDESVRLLLLVWIIAGFVENMPRPILMISGVQGAAKSTLVRYIARIIDPSELCDLNINDAEKAMLIIDQIWLVPLDNISHLRQEESDLLCKLATGGSFARRKLYTDSELMVRRLRRLVVVNGIDLVAKKADLLDRSLIIDMDRIPDSMRKPENLLDASFETELPLILGACFDILAKAYALRPNIELPSAPRMADFAHWGTAILKAIRPEATDTDFLKIYGENVNRQESETINASPLALCIVKYFTEKGPELSGTPTDVLAKLKDYAGSNSHSLPQTANSFGKKIKEIKPSLEKMGASITISKGFSRSITISMLPNTILSELSLSSCRPDPLSDFNPEEVF